MAEDYEVILAGYPVAETAKHDFDQLVGLVKEKKVETEGLILVERDASGEVRVSETGDHLARKGMGWGGESRPTRTPTPPPHPMPLRAR